MRNLLILLLTAFALPTAVIAEVSQVSKSRPAWMEEKIKGCQNIPQKLKEITVLTFILHIKALFLIIHLEKN